MEILAFALPEAIHIRKFVNGFQYPLPEEKHKRLAPLPFKKQQRLNYILKN